MFESGGCKWGVEPICTVLQVAPSTYWSAKSRPPSARALPDAVVGPVLVALFVAKYSGDLSITQRHLGRRLVDRGNIDEGVGLLRHALDHQTVLYQADPTPEARRDLSLTRRDLERQLG